MFYLAATAAELANFQDFSAKPAFMACHFCPSSSGISNIPRYLPPESLLLLDDRIPPADHDPSRVIAQLSQAAEDLGCAGVYLDFQRKGYPLLAQIAALAREMPCPVAVSQVYSGESSLPVVLPPAPIEVPLAVYIAPWKGREIWLEVASDAKRLTLTPQGCEESILEEIPAQGFREEKLCCHYTVQTRKDAAIFNLWRTYEDLSSLMQTAQTLGVVHTLGLFQELKGFAEQ